MESYYLHINLKATLSKLSDGTGMNISFGQNKVSIFVIYEQGSKGCNEKQLYKHSKIEQVLINLLDKHNNLKIISLKDCSSLYTKFQS